MYYNQPFISPLSLTLATLAMPLKQNVSLATTHQSRLYRAFYRLVGEHNPLNFFQLGCLRHMLTYYNQPFISPIKYKFNSCNPCNALKAQRLSGNQKRPLETWLIDRPKRTYPLTSTHLISFASLLAPTGALIVRCASIYPPTFWDFEHLCLSIMFFSFHSVTRVSSITLLVHWSTGPLVHWLIGPLVHWSIGPLAHWPIGSLVHWSIGPLVH